MACHQFSAKPLPSPDCWFGPPSVGNLLVSFQNDFTKEDFESMPAALAYKMFKSKSQFPLHTAIRAHREDVVFLYLVEHNLQVCG